MIGAAEIDEMMAEYVQACAGQKLDLATLAWPPTLDGSGEARGQALRPDPRRPSADPDPAVRTGRR